MFQSGLEKAVQERIAASKLFFCPLRRTGVFAVSDGPSTGAAGFALRRRRRYLPRHVEQ